MALARFCRMITRVGEMTPEMNDHFLDVGAGQIVPEVEYHFLPFVRSGLMASEIKYHFRPFMRSCQMTPETEDYCSSLCDGWSAGS